MVGSGGNFCGAPARTCTNPHYPAEAARIDRSCHRNHGMHAAVPSAGRSHRSRAARSQDGRAQLRSRRQRLEPVLGFEHACPAARARDQGSRDRRHRLRGARPDFSVARTTCWTESKDLREGKATRGALDARHRRLDSQLSLHDGGTRDTRSSGTLGGDGAHFVSHLSAHAWLARRPHRVARRVLPHGVGFSPTARTGP